MDNIRLDRAVDNVEFSYKTIVQFVLEQRKCQNAFLR